MEQKNGAIVRRLVGYGRLSGREATKALAQLYESSRLCINSFQLSFELKSKTRDGARVRKVYFAPATPGERLVAHGGVEPAIKERLRAQFKRLDLVRLLQEIRSAQQVLSDIAAHGVPTEVKSRSAADVGSFRACRQPGPKATCVRRIASNRRPNTGGERERIRSPTRGPSSKGG
ncbi:hypothetical protein [Variovorax saccharolyticus]|uniref:hypothetical protein n=1 Tax=Variovorax saccharolyticus TaxID=3053516 RepID=UPI0025791ECC|nr:hypothetical protein [Variovorax sp. J31P216]MDM0029806.1 hypothetical protein [Variovorax sp. J31P216]